VQSASHPFAVGLVMSSLGTELTVKTYPEHHGFRLERSASRDVSNPW